MLLWFRSTALYARLSRYPTLHQFVRYALVGVLNVVTYFALFNLLLWAGLHIYLANAIAFLITSINSFVLNKLWAFKDHRREGVVRQYTIFVSFTLIGLAINTAALTVFLIPLGRYGIIGKNLAALLALPFSVAWNFLSYRKWTFKPAVRAGAASTRSPGSSVR